LLASAVGSQLDQYNALVGETLGAEVPAAASTTITMQPPGQDAPPLPVSIRSGVDDTRWTFDKTELHGAGIYQASFGTANERRAPFAVNVNTGDGGDASESNLQKAEPDELPRQLLVQTDWQDLDNRPVGEISRPSGIQRWLLYAALAVALVEMALAWRFGKGVA
jgi:hypothetical protein